MSWTVQNVNKTIDESVRESLKEDGQTVPTHHLIKIDQDYDCNKKEWLF